MTDKHCERCGATFTVGPSRAATARYCSRPCMSRRTDVACAGCGHAFTVKTSKAATARFCSVECKATAETTRQQFKCGSCGCTFIRKRCKSEGALFCSKRCRGAYQRLMTPTKVRKHCARCGRVYMVKPRLAESSKYCRRDCMSFWKVNGLTAERHRTYQNIRRLSLLARGGNFTLEGWLAKCKFWGWRCYLCGVGLTTHTAQIEHRTPISRGGSNWLANLAPACAPCNRRKYTKTESEFRCILAASGWASDFRKLTT